MQVSVANVIARCRARVHTLSPRWILLIGLAVFLVYAFPGYMSTDSQLQLREARTGRFSDGHPPLMAAEWYVLDRIVSGPILMLLLQGVLLLGGLYVLLQRVLSPRASAWTSVGVLLFPPVLTTMAVIWKDSQMAAYLVAGTAALLQPRLRTRVIGLVLLAGACGMRHNALVAVVPIVFFMFEWRTGLRWWKRITVLLVATVLTIAATFAVARLLTADHMKMTPVFSDIVGMIAVDEDRSDEDLRELLRGVPLAANDNIQARARKLHALGGSWRTMVGDERIYEYPTKPEEWQAIYRAWKELALGSPLLYFESHWDHFSVLLGVGDVYLRGPVWNLFLEDTGAWPEVEHFAQHSYAQWLMGRAFYWLAEDTPIFRPWIYAVVGLLLLALFCRDRVTAGLLTSGFLYELSFFPAGANPDYRYSHWMITSVCIVTVILFVQRRRERAA